MIEKKHKTLAIIPARKNSKRFPGKNHKTLGSIPLFMHSINYAKNNSEFIDEIIISTDDPVIFDTAENENVRLIKRPDNLGKDTTSTLEVLVHVLEDIGEKYDNVILLQPTNPLRPLDLLKHCWQLYTQKNLDSLFTVSSTFKKFGKIKNDNFEPFNYKFGHRSQDLEPLYYENGLLYIAKAEMIRNGKLMDGNSFPYIVDHPFAEVDIDEQVDFDYAEFLLNRSENK
ncbi:acylneuraminate cytidylyltransferase family protein [uncultured Christiangramia sp.]|uniref:acylneuraminate cytidylyltransferase family protein n=1 Tax=uncultured Christiangramia sp. TaxID=503836 RepID=UPI0025CDCDA9|nr:acylneuraminate cytidylyltransferase family protein [uncultured Christiangramia sp.]